MCDNWEKKIFDNLECNGEIKYSNGNITINGKVTLVKLGISHTDKLKISINLICRLFII